MFRRLKEIFSILTKPPEYSDFYYNSGDATKRDEPLPSTSDIVEKLTEFLNGLAHKYPHSEKTLEGYSSIDLFKQAGRTPSTNLHKLMMNLNYYCKIHEIKLAQEKEKAKITKIIKEILEEEKNSENKNNVGDA